MIKTWLHKQYKTSDSVFELDVNFELKEGDFTCIYGPSGSGKSSVLRLIAGLDHADKGFLHFEKITWVNLDKNIDLSPQKRSVGIVFQEYNLFPNMTVLQNVKYGAKGDNQFASALIDQVDLSTKTGHYPHQLSGGEKQRVALIRAIASKPKILLLDEPFSSLDFELKQKLYEVIKLLKETYKLTILMISHDPLEVAQLATSVIMLDQGTITNQGTPEELLQRQLQKILNQCNYPL